jgi:hypothetical protein
MNLEHFGYYLPREAKNKKYKKIFCFLFISIGKNLPRKCEHWGYHRPMKQKNKKVSSDIIIFICLH